jgi:drug/metabolite transporter (DMT)-like permease
MSVSAGQWVLILIGVASSAVGGILLKVGAMELPAGATSLQLLLAAALNWKLALAIVLYLVPLVLWMHLLRVLDISLLQPMLALVYVVTPLLAWAVLGERVSSLRMAGIGVVILGVVIIARS